MMRIFFYCQSDAVSSKAKDKWEEIVLASYAKGESVVIKLSFKMKNVLITVLFLLCNFAP